MAVDPRQATLPEAPATVVAGEPVAAGAPIRQASLWRDAWRRYVRNKAAVLAGVVFVLIVLYAVIVPIFSPYDPDKVDFSLAYLRPTLEHPFGTDQFGRDLFTRTALGGRVSILIGIGAAVAILVIGVLYGAISGFVGG